ncbi:MAG: Spi family protease inhibitor, partial [Bacteroidota bacterium]|nr:Spi family protease inhibitor [Bacteroidota bacterium]
MKRHMFVFLILVSNISFAQKVSISEVKAVAKNFTYNTGQYELSSQKPEITTYYSQQLNDKLFYVLNYENAYIVISANKKYTPIKAFS